MIHFNVPPVYGTEEEKIEVSVGDTVIFAQYAGTEVKYDGIFPFLDGRSLSNSSLYYTQLLLLDLYKAACGR